MKIIDNNTVTLKESLISAIRSGNKVSIAASCFSIYAFKELFEQLKDVEELRFLFTSPTFIKNEKKSEIFPDTNDTFEDDLYGSKFETKLRNALNQKAIAREFSEWIKQDKIHFRSNKSGNTISGFAVIQSSDKNQSTTYAPLQGFTTVELGTSEKKDNYNLIQELDAPFSKQYLTMFNNIWRDKKSLVDVKECILKKIETICAENSPEFVYYVALNYIFSEFLSDIFDEDFYANERSGFKNSVVWNALFDFQKDAALAIINKLEKFNGCILADSVGLGKTYTALAVVKYYEARNKNVLVLCPKKLSENWNTFRGNFRNNPLVKDKFRYDVLYHTDLNRTGDNAYSNGINLSCINWSNYDLLIIDESHNFRNGGSVNNAKMNRYQILREKVIRPGVNTKVLMLSATPVNNRFNDLRNQLQLAYQDGDPKNIEDKLDTRNTIDGIFKRAQIAFNNWSNLEPDQRTTAKLIAKLDTGFFELLDSVTIARSRKHIQMYYDTNAIGAFPQRLSPLSYSPGVTDLEHAADYDEIFEDLLNLWLSIYTPSHYIKKEKRHLYAEQFGDMAGNTGFSQENREQGLRRLMAINLMKRLESSVCSFTLTLERIGGKIADTLDKIDEFLKSRTGSIEDVFDYDIDDEEMTDDLFSVGNKVKINFCDMEIDKWQATLLEDKLIIDELYKKVKIIDAAHDLKLQTLFKIIDNKVENPINAGNKKILIFTAFADTAEYLFENVSKHARKLGLNVAMITGRNEGMSTINGLKCDLNTILSCFSPRSKNRDAMNFDFIASNANIDILIGTDCISEGQNLQDCDYCINYDIHWNPVRIIQRYGRIDRIGSTNTAIQLVNFWPDVSLDEYINLKQRVETRMKIVNITSTTEEKVLSNEEKVDLEYRKSQLEKLKMEVIDIEDISSGVSITDLGLNEFKLDLLDYAKNNKMITKAKTGLYAVAKSNSACPPGIIFVLKNISMQANAKNQNLLHPFYLVYIEDDGKIHLNHLSPKGVLTDLRRLCKGYSDPDEVLYRVFNNETKDGANMAKYSHLLAKVVESIIEVKKEADINSLFRSTPTDLSKKNKISGIDDFELVCFLVVK